MCGHDATENNSNLETVSLNFSLMQGKILILTIINEINKNYFCFSVK